MQFFIGHGAERNCYEHPGDPSKCIKVARRGRGNKDPLKEVKVAALVERVLSDYIVSYQSAPVKTKYGVGLVAGLVRDSDGEISQTLLAHMRTGPLDKETIAGLNRFFALLLYNDIFFYDFGFENFVVQKTASGKKIKFIDLKSLNSNGYLGFLNLEYFFAPLARIIMFRRIRRFYRRINVSFPFDRLCRKKLFDTLLVNVR